MVSSGSWRQGADPGAVVHGIWQKVWQEQCPDHPALAHSGRQYRDPGSKNPAHIKENFNLFDFALTDDEMGKITALDKQKRYYTSTPEMLKKYAEMVPPVDEQK